MGKIGRGKKDENFAPHSEKGDKELGGRRQKGEGGRCLPSCVSPPPLPIKVAVLSKFVGPVGNSTFFMNVRQKMLNVKVSAWHLLDEKKH